MLLCSSDTDFIFAFICWGFLDSSIVLSFFVDMKTKFYIYVRKKDIILVCKILCDCYNVVFENSKSSLGGGVHLCAPCIKIKDGHTPKERRQGAHFPFIGRWARRWINHYCLSRIASATPHLRLPSQPKLVLNAPSLPTEGWPGWVDLGGWLRYDTIVCINVE